MQPFDSSLPIMLYRTLDAVMPKFRQIYHQFDLTEQQWRVMRILWEESELSSVELAKRALLMPPSLVGIIDRLEKKQLVERHHSVDDRRVVMVRATKASHALKEKVVPLVEDAFTSIEESVDPSDWRKMIETLQRVIESAEAPPNKSKQPTTAIKA